MGEFAPGTMLGGCRIDAVVGRGGMGVVYRARQLDLDRDVAVKVIAPELVEDPQIRKRFLKEVRAAGAVEHPNVVPVHGAGDADGRAYLVMRYITGHDVRTVVMTEGAIDPERATWITEQLGDALDAIHHAGYVHRDVKPQNVMLDLAGHVYLSDFGLAKPALATGGDTRSQQWVGTLDYVAPEQIRGEHVDARTDVYALGGVLHFMLTGRVPFERQNEHAKLWAHLSSPAPRPSDVRPELPPELDAVVLRAMAKDPADRYPSAGDLARSARSAAGHADAPGPERTVARGAAAPEGTTIASRSRVALAARRRRGPVIAAGALILAAGAAALLLLGRGDGDSGPRAESPRPTATPAPAGPRKGPTYDDVGFRPRGVLVAHGDVWVISTHEGEITRIDPRTGSHRAHEQWIGPGARGIAYHQGTIWITNRTRGALMGVSARTGKTMNFIETPLPPVHVAAGAGGIWVVGRLQRDGGPAWLYRYDGDSTAPAESHDFPRGITAIAAGGGYLWVAIEDGKRVMRVRPGFEPEQGAWLEESASELAFGDGHLWASVPANDTVEKIRPRIKNTVDSAEVGRPEQLVIAHGRVWVASGTEHSVVVLNSRTANRVADVRVPPKPYGVAAGARRVWVTGLSGRGTLTRIDPGK